jgi:hypothetical protein
VKWVSSKLYTYEFKDGINMKQLPLDFDVGDVWVYLPCTSCYLTLIPDR